VDWFGPYRSNNRWRAAIRDPCRRVRRVEAGGHHFVVMVVGALLPLWGAIGGAVVKIYITARDPMWRTRR